MTRIIKEMDFSVKITRKRVHVPSFISQKSYFPLLYLEIDLLTLKMTFNHQNSTRNSLLIQNDTKKGQYHMKKTYYTSSLFSFLNLIFFTF